jgi:tellurite resistance protein TerC
MHDIAFFWIFNAFVILLLVLDLCVLHRKAQTIALREAILWSGFWILLAVLFAGLLYFMRGSQTALEFATGYLIESLLSVDNLFVFIVIFSFFQIPREYEYRILFWGIVGALITRGLFIFIGVALINEFAPFVEYFFGAFLVYTGYRLGRGSAHKIEPEKNIVLRLARRLLPVTSDNRQGRFFVREQGRLMVTPLLLVLLIIESTDVLFATDSIPAILGVTHNVLVVYTSNIFAIMGLRALYFALSGAISRFSLLKYGLSLILVLIGIKMLANHFVTIPTWVTLVIVASVVAISVVASLVVEKSRVQTIGE